MQGAQKIANLYLNPLGKVQVFQYEMDLQLETKLKQPFK
jgi:hypothetical protein